MPTDEPTSNIPLADVLRAANGLVAAKLIEDWALGGALAAIYYVEPFTTYDADIFFIPTDKGLTAGIPAIYAYLQAQGWQVEREHLLLGGFPTSSRLPPAWAGKRTRPALSKCSSKPNSTKRGWKPS